jgi:NitT/TauT family transport system substrate-binding protein
MRKQFVVLFCLFIFSVQAEPTTVRVGHFPNLTHAQAVIGHGYTRAGQGWFEKWLGPEVVVEWYVYNAGSSAMESLLAGSIDLVYVGPTPTINTFLRTEGNAVHVIAGACSGGAALVVRDDSGIAQIADFKGKRLATPQLGNTQDVAARAWLRSNHFKVTLQGGDVWVLPTPNPDQLMLFKTKELDAAWTVEPWVSRLQLEANGKIFLMEKELWPATDGQYVTTHLVANRSIMLNKALVKKWLEAHVALTQWIANHTEEAKRLFNEELQQEVRNSLSEAVLNQSWERIQLTWDPIAASLNKNAEDAYAIGFLKQKPDLKGLYQLELLNQILAEMKLPTVQSQL